MVSRMGIATVPSAFRKTYRCDGLADCSDEADEIGCGKN
jgi:hypothetical protein